MAVGRKPGSSPKIPQCPACHSAGGKPVKTLAWIQVDGRVRQARVVRGGKTVTRATAWVVCQRRIMQVMHGLTGRTCGWGWWSAHPAVVAKAKAHPSHRLVRRYAKPPGTPGRRGWGKHAEW